MAIPCGVATIAGLAIDPAISRGSIRTVPALSQK
jgi:hypothetical protein